MMRGMVTRTNEAQFIDIDELRIGMFVYLDLGWIRHPFALNSFKISSRDQIDTLIKLGVNRIRWSPDKSDYPDDPAAGTPDDPAPLTADSPRQAMAEAVAAGVAALARRREQLTQQSDSLIVCERQFATAARNYRQVMDNLLSQPEAAGTKVEEIVGNMVGVLQEQEETAIRLLSESVGERAAQHSINVTTLSLLLGKALGCDATALAALGSGALLHDIGKIELPDRLRWLDHQFNAAERNLYQEHVARGVAIGQKMRLPPAVLAIIAQHHELADGRGYPEQLSGDGISPLARIVALANHYDNLCNPANPGRAVTPHEAIAQIYATMKNQFESSVLMPFIRMMGVYPPGSVIELTDGRHALVVSVNAARPLRPRILIFDPQVPRNEALVQDLEQLPDIGIRRSLKPLQLPKSAFDYLSPRQRICYFFERARLAAGGPLP